MNVREWALPVYTILMQTAMGSLFFLWLIRIRESRRLDQYGKNRLLQIPLTIILVTIFFAMVGAHFHLSKPFLSLLAVSNFRTSWLSREIVFTILFFFLTFAIWLLHRLRPSAGRLIDIIGWGAILCGWAMIYCMARIYLLPTQISWNSPTTILHYIGTTFLLGSSALLAILWMDQRFVSVRNPQSAEQTLTRRPEALTLLAVIVLAAAILDISIELYQIAALRVGSGPARTSLELLFGLYQPLLFMRIGLVLIGSSWLAYNTLQLKRLQNRSHDQLLPVYASFMLLMIGEILGRFLFYATHVRIGL